MEVNNYNRIKKIVEEINYGGKWCLLRFIRRRTETGEANRTLSRQFIKWSKIKMDEVISYCEENQCRCYLTFMDNVLESAWKALGSPLDKIDAWRKKELFNLDGLHLIDVDDLSLEEAQIAWLENNGVTQIFILPSKTGHSIIFYSNSHLILDYQKTGWNSINNFHMMASINLYIPEFKPLD